jgi:hypothetical protein
VPYPEDLLTPVHSLPSSINSSNVSGSKGRFSECLQEKPPKPRSSFSKIPSLTNPKQTSKDSPSSPGKISLFSLERKEKQENSVKFERNLTQSEKQDLCGRLDDELKKRLETSKIQRTSKRTNSLPQEDVVTRLLKYGESVKKRNQDRIREKQEKEEEELQKFQKSQKSQKSLHGRKSPVSPNFSSPGSFSINSPSLSSNSASKVLSKIQRLVKSSSFNL